MKVLLLFLKNTNNYRPRAAHAAILQPIMTRGTKLSAELPPSRIFYTTVGLTSRIGLKMCLVWIGGSCIMLLAFQSHFLPF